MANIKLHLTVKARTKKFQEKIKKYMHLQLVNANQYYLQIMPSDEIKHNHFFIEKYWHYSPTTKGMMYAISLPNSIKKILVTPWKCLKTTNSALVCYVVDQVDAKVLIEEAKTYKNIALLHNILMIKKIRVSKKPELFKESIERQNKLWNEKKRWEGKFKHVK